MSPRRDRQALLLVAALAAIAVIYTLSSSPAQQPSKPPGPALTQASPPPETHRRPPAASQHPAPAPPAWRALAAPPARWRRPPPRGPRARPSSRTTARGPPGNGPSPACATRPARCWKPWAPGPPATIPPRPCRRAAFLPGRPRTLRRQQRDRQLAIAVEHGHWLAEASPATDRRVLPGRPRITVGAPSTKHEPRANPSPVCRRAGCPNPSAAATFGYCIDCGLTYIRWRVTRDELERLDLAAAGYTPASPSTPTTKPASTSCTASSPHSPSTTK